jgi:hypothetical protein
LKTRITKQLLQDMPEQVRALVTAWADQYHKRFIRVESAESFYSAEDAHITLVNLLTGASGSARCAGEWAGFTELSPTAAIPLPVGVVAVEDYIFCGHPMLTVWQGSRKQIAPTPPPTPERQELASQYAATWRAGQRFDPADCGGTWDGFTVGSDADPGL